MNIAIIGSTGNVGRKTIEILEKTKLKFDEIYLVASSKSAGKKIKFRNKNIKVESLVVKLQKNGCPKHPKKQLLLIILVFLECIKMFRWWCPRLMLRH